MIINSHKELAECLPENFREIHKKWLRKILSVASNNRFDVVVNDGIIEISRTNNDIKVYKFVCLPKTNKPIPYKSKDNEFTHIIYLKTGFTSLLPRYPQLIGINKDGTAFSISNNLDVRSFLNKSNEVVKFTTECNYIQELFRNPLFFKNLTWEEAKNYHTYICIKDTFMFHRGMIVNNNSYNNYYLQSPISKFGKTYYSFENICCDLSKTSLKELETINVGEERCVKHRFGCTRGCLNECNAKISNEYEKNLKKIYINLYEKVMLNE
jgi:hypothetical protein